MFELSWGEILLCMAVAVLITGPEDLPRLMRTAGVWMGRARRWGQEMQAMLDGFIAESERRHAAEKAESAVAREAPITERVADVFDPTGALRSSFVPESPPEEEEDEDEPEYHPPQDEDERPETGA